MFKVVIKDGEILCVVGPGVVVSTPHAVAEVGGVAEFKARYGNLRGSSGAVVEMERIIQATSLVPVAQKPGSVEKIAAAKTVAELKQAVLEVLG